MYIYVLDSSAGSIRCSCLKFITPGFIGNLLTKLDILGRKLHCVDGINTILHLQTRGAINNYCNNYCNPAR